MSEPVKIAIVMEGGLVQSVITAGVPVEFVVVDYDTEGAALDETVLIPQDGGGTERAFVRLGDAEADGPFWERVHALAEAEASDPPPIGGNMPEAYGYEKTLECYDAGDLDDEQAIAELQRAGWSERRAYVILEQHQNA